jgi:hypothetical protein
MAFLAGLAGCDGGLAHRSLAEMSGDLPVGPEIRRVRLEIQAGTVGIAVHEARVVHFGGGMRRAADTAEQLAAIEALPIDPKAFVDPADATTMVVRGPHLVEGGPQGVLAYEMGLLLPADLELEVVVEGSGGVTVVDRKAPLKVSTGRGDLRFERCIGGTKAYTGRGVVIAIDMGGRVDIESAVGDMQVFVTQPGDLLRLRTGQGTIQCYIPPDAGFVCNARAEVGRAGSSFGLEKQKTTDFGAAMTGTHGDGKTKIVLTTGSGYLSLQKHGN